ncbi:MAG: DUF5946 family protein [Hyphomicrobiales bacterium]
MCEFEKSNCPGCKIELPIVEGPIHNYMDGSAACFELFNQILACEYSDPALLPTHRMTVDTYAVQHPGDASTRQQIQSVGLRLARLFLQLSSPMQPKETNNVMLDLGKHKHTLDQLEPPKRFAITVADVAPFSGSARHSEKVREWANATWEEWGDHHAYIRIWTQKWL